MYATCVQSRISCMHALVKDIIDIINHQSSIIPTSQHHSQTILVATRAGLVLKIFLILLPKILSVMNHFAGMVSISQVDFGVVEKFFIFQLCTVFLASTVAGTALSQIKAIMSDPSQIWGVIQKIANGIPQQATFFMTWVMLNVRPVSAPAQCTAACMGYVCYGCGSCWPVCSRPPSSLWVMLGVRHHPAAAVQPVQKR
jgi:hypothetical protein